MSSNNEEARIALSRRKTYTDRLRPADNTAHRNKDITRDRIKRKMTAKYQWSYILWRDFSLLTALLTIMGLVLTGYA